MHPNFYLSPVVVCLALGMASTAKAANPFPLQKETLPNLQQRFQLVLPGIKTGITARDQLHFLKQQTDTNAVTHIRMQQFYEGYPVIGGYVIVHSNKSATQVLSAQDGATMTGMVYEGLQNELGMAPEQFEKNGAQALEAFKNKYKNKTITAEEIAPVVYIDEENKAHWAYKVSLFIQNQNHVPSKPSAILDARTHEAFVQWNDIKTQKVVKGMGFGGNSRVGEYQYGKDLPLLEISRTKDMCSMENPFVKVIDMKQGFEARSAMQFKCKSVEGGDADQIWTGYKGDGYDKINQAFSPSNDALYAGDVIKKMYKNWYNMEVLTQADGKPMQLVMRVHYGDEYENAYWDGKQMTFGDGGEMMYPLVSLGVGAHEISHGFTEQHADLVYYGQAGGINESFSDMAAQAAEFYSLGKSSWKIGWEIMKEDSGYDALRYMDDPKRDERSISSADEYYPGLDVHYSSGVYNHLFYLIATTEGWTTRKAFDVMVKANADYWTPYSQFIQAGCGVLNATQDLKYSIQDVKNALDKVKISYNSCNLEKPRN